MAEKRKQYRKEKVTTSDGTFLIPVGEDGFVPTSELVRRFNDIHGGVSDGRTTRSPLKDYDERADVVLPEKVTPRQAAAWWAHPAEFDVEGIDAPGAPKIRKGMRFYGTNAEAIKMDQMVDAATSPEERRGLTEKDVSYSARPLRKGVLGLYDGRGVQLERQGGLNTDVTGHESNHALRHRGGDRKGILVRHNDSPNVEESCTVAEEMARTRDLGSSHGYYEHVAVWDGDAGRWRKPTPREQERMIREDVDLFTYGRGKPLKGRAAIRSVEENWEHSHIARLRYKSRRMAIDEIASQDPSFSRAASDAKTMARAYAPGEKPIRPRPTKRGESPKTACMQPGSKPGTRTKKGKPGGAKKTQSGRASGRRGAAKAGKNAGRRK